VEPYDCCVQLPVVKTKVLDVWIQMLGFSKSENGCMQESFLKRMHARVLWANDVCNQKGHSDGCTNRTFGQRMRARYGANPGCAQPTSRMSTTSLTQTIAKKAKSNLYGWPRVPKDIALYDERLCMMSLGCSVQVKSIYRSILIEYQALVTVRVRLHCSNKPIIF